MGARVPLGDPKSRITIDPVTGCWIWGGKVRPNGYGRFGRLYSHRLYYETLVGPIPVGTELDHLCRNRICCNPAHLEPVTQYVNTIRGTNPAAINKRKSECNKGHAFTPENTVDRVDKNGRPWRECRTCKRDWGRTSYARRLAKAA